MKKEDVIALIQKEVEENPQVTSIEISKKYGIPFYTVEIVRSRLAKNVMR
ncbi:hypothetical protein [Paenibacillus mesophilus]|nr:hypothetical protein [Paenibacillus mesophilus]